jgi:hypothetical protein
MEQSSRIRAEVELELLAAGCSCLHFGQASHWSKPRWHKFGIEADIGEGDLDLEQWPFAMSEDKELPESTKVTIN